MRIEYVTLKNFGPHAKFEIELVNGLIGIFGRNGAGKSTFVNGIYAALTNDFGRFDGTKADCIFDGADPKDKSFIEIEAEHEGTHFTLLRSLRPNKSVLTVAGEKPVTKANEIEARLREDLGVDMKLVDKYVFVDQWQMFQFLSHTPSQRADAFKHLCRTEKADVCHNALGVLLAHHQPSDDFVDNSDELITAISSLESGLETLRNERKDQEKLLLNDKSLASAKKIVRSREKHGEAVQAAEELQEEVHELEEKVFKRESTINKLNQSVQSREKTFKAAAAEVDKAKAALSNLSTYEKRRKRKDKLNEAAVALIEEGLKYEKPPKKPKDYDQLKEMRSSVATLQRDLENAEGVVEIEDAECPTCHQSVTDEFRAECQDAVNNLPGEIKELEEKIAACEAYDKAVSRFKTGKADWEARLKANKEELEQFGELSEPEGDKDALEETIEEYEGSLEDLEQEKQDLAEKREGLSKMEGKLNEKGAQLKKLQAEVEANVVSDDLFDKANTRMKEHNAAEIRIAEIDGVIGEREGQLTEKQQELTRLRKIKKRRKKLDRLLKIAGRAREAFHWNQLPRMVAQGNLVNMEQDINNTLDWFGNPFWAEADENLGFLVHLPGHNNPRRAEGLSGGQKGVLAISFRVGVNSLFGADIGMMWLDEPTAGLDEENVGYFGEALVKLAAEVRDKRQLVVITHAADLKTSFDQVIEIG